METSIKGNLRRAARREEEKQCKEEKKIHFSE